MSDPSDCITIPLPQKVDIEAAKELETTLQANIGKPVHLDMSDVSYLGGFAGEVMLSAQLRWANDNISLTLSDPSEAVTTHLDLMGLDITQLTHEAVA